MTQLGHKTGDKSPHFDVLVGNSGRANIVFEKETRKAFIRIHELRTRGLHRLEKQLDRAEIPTIAVGIYIYFQYVDEFSDAQRAKIITLKGKRYRRLKYGEDVLKYVNRRDLEFAARDKRWGDAELPCHDCHAIKGQYHGDNCDIVHLGSCCWAVTVATSCADYLRGPGTSSDDFAQGNLNWGAPATSICCDYAERQREFRRAWTTSAEAHWIAQGPYGVWIP